MEHPAVAEAGVIGKPDPVAVEIVKAFVSLKSGFTADAELRRELLGFARTRLGAVVAPRRSSSGRRCRRRAAARSCAGCSRRASWGCRKATPRRSRRARREHGRRRDACRRGERALGLLRQMLLIRRFEEKAAELYTLGKIRGFLHLYIGEEAVAVGAMQALTADGQRRRDLPRARARAGRAASRRGRSWRRCTARRTAAAAAAAARCTCSTSRAGSTAATPSSAAGSRSPSAWPWPTRCGSAAAVTACFFGDGAVAEGEFHESLNLAALWRLPVLFLCENNLYAMGTALARHQAQTDIAAQGRGLRRAAARPSTAWTCSPSRRRPGGRPRPCAPGEDRCLLEARTYRFRAHSMYDPELYRVKDEVEQWKQRDPIALFTRAAAAERDSLGDAELAALDRGSRSAPRSTRAVAFAEAGPWEPVGGSAEGRLHRRRRGDDEDDLPRGGPQRAAGGAAQRSARLPDGRGRRSLRRRLRREPGLLEEFGPERVRDTPLSESTFVGAGIGAALGGMRPIVEVMTVNFSLLALDQIVNNAATLRHMSGGQLSVPLVVRMATGRRPAARRPALAQPRGLVRAHPRASRSWRRPRAHDARGMLPGGAARAGPRLHLRARDALPDGGRGGRDGRPRRDRPSGGAARGHAT